MPWKQWVKYGLRPLNLAVPTRLNGTWFRVPVLRGVGIGNLRGSDDWMTDCLRRLFTLAPQSPVVDVGVNLGQTLLKVKSLDRATPYLGFEPNPFCVVYVEELIRINRLVDCDIVPVGLGDAAGLVALVVASETDSNASLIGDLRPDTIRTRRLSVPVVPFDATCASLVEPKQRIVKIDVEGSELEVLIGMKVFLEQQRPFVICEVLHAHSEHEVAMLRTRNGQLRTLLEASAYEPYRLVKDSTHSRIGGLEHVGAFDEAVWDPLRSPSLCDYLFVPREEVPRAEAAFR